MLKGYHTSPDAEKVYKILVFSTVITYYNTLYQV